VLKVHRLEPDGTFSTIDQVSERRVFGIQRFCRGLWMPDQVRHDEQTTIYGRMLNRACP
jgi:hypothetical protein